MVNIQNYEKVVAYGIGAYFEKRKSKILKALKIDYVCDRKWEGSDIDIYDGLPIITRVALRQMKNTLVVIMVERKSLIESIRRDLEGYVDVVHVDELVNCNIHLTGKELREKYPNGKYEDARNNSICFDKSMPDGVYIHFSGNNNSLVIGRDVVTERLTIVFGDNGMCSIGDNTEIIELECQVSDAEVSIGKYCLFSSKIQLQTHDGHHIFDMTTKKRLNWPKNIIVGDHVWIGMGVVLLGGAQIGTGSVVGSNAVTSSQFGKNQIIIGAPARVLRENIVWSKDATRDFNHASLEECVDQRSLEYLNVEVKS